MSDHSITSLIEKLEGAEVGSASLGRDILVELGVVERIERSLYYGVGNEDVWHYGAEAEKEGVWRMLPDPTTSLDAALALAERVLPSARVMVERFHDGKGWAMVQCASESAKIMTDGNTPALALCSAILLAQSEARV